MENTLIVYPQRSKAAKQTAETCACILSMAKALPVNQAPKSLEPYPNLILLLHSRPGPHAPEPRSWLSSVTGQLKEKRIAAICITADEQQLNREITQLAEAMKRPLDFAKALPENALQDSVISCALRLADQLNQPGAPMERDLLKQEIDRFLNAHSTCALAAGCGSFVRCTPIEYFYHQDCLYLLSEGGKKFAGLLQNPNVSVAVFDSFTGWSRLGGMQLTCRAEIVPLHSEEYQSLVELRGLDPKKLLQMPISLNLIRLIPSRIDFTWSGFRENDAEIRQTYQYD